MSLRDIADILRVKIPVDEDQTQSQPIKSEDYQFYRIKKISITDDLEENELQKYVNQCVYQFINSMMDTKSILIYRIVSSSKDRSISIFIGTKKKFGQSLPEKFGASFQYAEVKEANGKDYFESFNNQALITGIPAENETNHFEYIEPFIRYIIGKTAMLEVIAKPIKKSSILRILDYVMEERTKNSIKLKSNYSESTAITDSFSTSTGETKTDGNSNGAGFILSSNNSNSTGKTNSDSETNGTTKTETTSSEQLNYLATGVDALLEKYSQRFMKALSSGLWKTAISVFTENRDELTSISDIYKSTYNGNAIEPYFVFPLKKTYQLLGMFEKEEDIFIFQKNRHFSFLTSEELSYVIDLPKKEYYGYIFEQLPRFNQNVLSLSGIPLGNIYDGEKKTNTLFEMSQDQLNKHLLVAGITGSGKTNTIFNIIKNINVPFLIIEPAKKEYRGLFKAIPNLKIYTLGNEKVSPIRLNPFYFPENVSIQQHIDNLKVIFNASFTMYASMPNILEQSINNIYIKKGWNLTTSKNIYQSNDYDNFNKERYFPTIEDLYFEIDRYTRTLGYAQEQMQNIRAALLTRIKSLMTGGKGLLLNTTETMDIEELMKYPTVLELEAIADDEEKSLIIGLVSIFIYEYLKSYETEFTGRFKHLLVFEEAHRIFTNVSQNSSQEDVNIKGKAVESLSQILSEIRAYGEGMIIIDQVPKKLAPDVLKNTNTKIIHRIVARDDCEYVANSLALSDQRASFISKLTNGAALLYTDGMHSPVHLQMLYGKEDVRYISDQEVVEYSQSYNPLKNLLKNMHPVTEMILEDLSSFIEIKKQVGDFYELIYKDSLKKLRSNYEKAKENIIHYALNYGFDMNINPDDFAFSLIAGALAKMVKANEEAKRNVNRQIFMERYIEACLDAIFKDYEIYKKEFILLELNQKKLRGEYIV